jgi:DNA-binding NarL/FixJ family response regulator
MIRLMLLDDTRLFTEGVVTRFAAEPGFQLVATASDCEEGLEQFAELRPDIVMMEVGLPGRGSFECAAQILRIARGTRVVLLTSCLCDVLLDAALRLGVSGYLLKEDSFAVLFQHLRRIARGERRYSVKVQERLQRAPRQAWMRSRSAACLSTLTQMQLEILRHLARGDSVKEVSLKVNLTQRSVEALKYRVMQQLGVHDRVSLARFAIREGLTVP